MDKDATTCRPYFDPEYELFLERLHPPRVCIDNESCPDCSVVKVDGPNGEGMLLKMVQALTDLDLLISKSYITSDGQWIMDVFDVTDRHRKKLTDQILIHDIQQAICLSKNYSPSCCKLLGRSTHLSKHTALEVTCIDRTGLMSEMSAVLMDLGCHVSAAVAWTHKARAACIIYLEDDMDSARLSQLQARLEIVVESHHCKDEKWSVGMAAPSPDRTHTERRLHQLMAADRDNEECDVFEDSRVSIDKCREYGYLVVTLRSRDKPKLFFDTVCALSDLEYEVHHATISTQGSIAFQEYYVKKKNGHTLMSDETEHQRLIQCLIAATERRTLDGQRLDIYTGNRPGLLLDLTRVLRENGLLINLAEIKTNGENATATFYVKHTTGLSVSPRTVETIRQQIGGNIVAKNASFDSHSRTSSVENEERLNVSVWSYLESISNTFAIPLLQK